MANLPIICKAQYLAEHVDNMRYEDYDATHLVKATKGLPLHPSAYTSIRIGGKRVKIREANKDEALEWFAEWAAPLVDAFGNQSKVIVPIPGSAVTRRHSAPFRTAMMADATSAKCITPVTSSTVLRWNKAKASVRNGGTRNAALLHMNLAVSQSRLPAGDIVLLDDVFTTGGHVKAAAWCFEDLGRTVLGAICCGRTTWQQLADPFAVGVETLDFTRP